jgi:hypothetical protein
MDAGARAASKPPAPSWERFRAHAEELGSIGGREVIAEVHGRV